jgi:hypothetical protein
MVIAVVLGACLVLLLIGLVAPRLANRTQWGINRKSAQAKGKARKAPTPVEKVVDKTVENARKAADASLEAGKKVHDKVS